MSIPALSALPASPATAGAPVVNQALEPKWVRDGSPSTQKAYEAALSFEQTLVEQLAHSLTTTSGLGGESSTEEEGGEEGGSSMAGAGELSSTLPQALASGVMSAGGLGLAAQLTRGLEAAQGPAPAPTSAAPTPTSAAPTPTNAAAGIPGAAEGAGSQAVPTATGLTSSGAAMGATGGAAAADTGGTGA